MNEFYTNDVINLNSTSKKTADVDPIILNKTNGIQISFVPLLINNEKDKKNCISGKLTYTKKHKQDLLFPDTKISKKNIHVGDLLEIALSTSEVKKLYEGLKKLYDLHAGMEINNPMDGKFIKINGNLENAIEQLNDNHYKYSKDDIVKSISTLFKLLNQNNDTIDFDNITINEVEKIENLVNISKLQNAIDFFNKNMETGQEQIWQKYFEDHPWIISQIFHYPEVLCESQAYLGGKDISNTYGKNIDYLYKNKLTKNIALVEIKIPTTQLLSTREYRKKIYSASNELSGGISQLLCYKDTVIKNWNAIAKDEVLNYNPDCILIVGNTKELDSKEKKSSFDLLRSSLTGLNIITFDELKTKINDLIVLLESED